MTCQIFEQRGVCTGNTGVSVWRASAPVLIDGRSDTMRRLQPHEVRLRRGAFRVACCRQCAIRWCRRRTDRLALGRANTLPILGLNRAEPTPKIASATCSTGIECLLAPPRNVGQHTAKRRLKIGRIRPILNAVRPLLSVRARSARPISRGALTGCRAYVPVHVSPRSARHVAVSRHDVPALEFRACRVPKVVIDLGLARALHPQPHVNMSFPDTANAIARERCPICPVGSLPRRAS